MKRLLYASALAALIPMLPGSTALASQPTRSPTNNQSATFPAGVVCDFAVHIEPIIDKEVTTTFFDSAGNVTMVLITGDLVTEVSNVDKGTSLTVNISGPATITFLDDGTLVFDAVGSWLVATFPTDSPARVMFLNRGHIVFTIGPTGVLTVVSRIGRVQDLCAALA